MPYANTLILQNPERTAALRALSLLGTPAEPAFDRLTQLVAMLFQAPIALVTLVDSDRQFFKSQVGLPHPEAELRETPLSHSMCQHVVAHGAPLIIEDTRLHPLVYDNPAITDLGVIAYTGMPLILSSGYVVGAFCVIDHTPRQWTEGEIRILSDLAASVTTELELRFEIAERLRVEAALRESEARYRTVVTAMHEGVVLQDRDGTIRTCNPAAESILGLTANQMMGRTSIDPRWHAVREDGSPFPGEMHPAMVGLRTGQAQLNVVMGVHKPDGQLTWILINAQPLIDANSGIVYAILATFVDITERKQVQDRKFESAVEKERVSVLTSFIQHAAHEFRTPLTVIQTSAYIMHRLEPLERRFQKVQQINEQVTLITRLVDTLSFMVKLEQPAECPTWPLLDVNGIVTIAVNNLPLSDGDSPTIRANLQPDLPRIIANASYLSEALRQIMDNAYRFSPKHSVINVTTGTADQTIWIEIRDLGVGIAPEDQQNIFEIFWRKDELHTTPGFGLGLAIAKKIVQLHNGRIEVQSEVGKGSTFRVILPTASSILNPR
jgi:two-component system, sensor histidine kinase